MAVTDQIKIFDRKIKHNEAQYDLEKKAAKISALSSGNLDKYEYLTGEDLNDKPRTVEQAKFDYYPLSKFFNKGLKEDKKEGLLKRLKNIEDKCEEQVKAIKNKAEDKVTYFVEEPLGLEANALIEEIKIIQKDNDYTKFNITDDNNVTYDLYKINKLNLMQYSMLWVDTLQETKKYIEAKHFTRGEKKLLKSLKIEYFQFTVMMNIADLKTMMWMILEIEKVSLIMKSLLD